MCKTQFFVKLIGLLFFFFFPHREAGRENVTWRDAQKREVYVICDGHVAGRKGVIFCKVKCELISRWPLTNFRKSSMSQRN